MAIVEYASAVMLVTGIPGSGKTLSTIQRVVAWGQSSKRPVYYFGIKDLEPSLGWTELEDPNKWFEVPDGAIVVIDECQRYEFDRAWKPQKGAATAIPQAVREMETLRHRGLNLVLITQGAMLLNANVRRLVGLHYHVHRVMGMQRANIYEWNKVQTDPESAAAKRDAILHVWKYPPEVYKLYKSAEVHTIKRRIPMKVKLIVLLPFLLLAGGWYAYHFIIERKLGSADKVAAKSGSSTGYPGVQAGGSGGARPPKTQAEFLAERTPRISGLAMTAPVYDKLMEPKVVPKPVACAASATRCSCYTQQGTKLPEVAERTCRSIVANGFFDEAPDQKVDFDRQARNGSIVQAQNEPSRVGADVDDRQAQLPRQIRSERPWPADPAWRQSVSTPSGRSSNGGPSTNPKQAAASAGG